MTVRTWFCKLFARPAARPMRKPPARRRLCLETLEDRSLPSAVWYVNAAAAGHHTGTSWADADTDLQAALTSAQPGDQIWVAQGTYKPTGGTDRTVSFALKGGVAVYGGFAGTEAQLGQRDLAHHVTTLSGDIGVPGDSSDNSYHVVTSSMLDASAVLDGFTITAGNANASNVTGPEDDRGGGMYNDRSSPTLTNVTFSDNSAALFGGGMDNEVSSPTLTNVTFSGNSAAPANFGGGGGMCNFFSSSPTLTNVTFSDNSAYHGGGMFTGGNSSATLSNCILFGDSGGEISIDHSSATVSYSDVGGATSGQATSTRIPSLSLPAATCTSAAARRPSTPAPIPGRRVRTWTATLGRSIA
jgi:hypothetical protein